MLGPATVLPCVFQHAGAFVRLTRNETPCGLTDSATSLTIRVAVCVSVPRPNPDNAGTVTQSSPPQGVGAGPGEGSM